MQLFKKQQEVQSGVIITLKTCFLAFFLLSMACWWDIADTATHGSEKIPWGLFVDLPAMLATFIFVLGIAKKGTDNENVIAILFILLFAAGFDFLSCYHSEKWVWLAFFAKGIALYESFELMKDSQK